LVFRENVLKKDIVILLAEDDEGHAKLIVKNLKRAGMNNTVVHFRDGEEVLNFLFRRGKVPHREAGRPYLLLLDVRLPKVNGIEVLTRIKQDDEIKTIPVVMISTTDDPREVELCYKLGCSTYITKAVEYEQFVEKMKQLDTIPSMRT
jgi:CheY-like chemotaxis protein